MNIPENEQISIENFTFNMEFKTTKSDCNLLRLEDEDEPYKQIDLLEGKLILKFEYCSNGDIYKTVSDKKLDDNKWHTISVVCEYRKPIQVTVDGQLFEVKIYERKLHKFNCIGCGGLRVSTRQRFKG